MKLRQNEDEQGPAKGILALLRAVPGDFLVCLTFFTRLPAFLSVDHTRPMSRAAQMFPAIGLVIGIIGALVLSFGTMLQLPYYLISVLTITAMIIATGALHEDGLADMIDGFGGGHDRERKLEIMKDSHIGTYGVLALLLSQVMRVILLASLLPRGLDLAITVLLAAQMISRGYSMFLWAGLPPARSNGLSKQAGQPQRRALVMALVTTSVALLCLLLPNLNIIAILFATALSGLVSYLMIVLCRGQIGGQTGDTIGATQQLCDLAFMTGILISLGIAKELL
ncbi:adenosylcobinamide-GDP ribazoletransferase [Pararhizobium sp. IMCC21322]|uniref:adenosylcobinamide-GDP ribazoletransferase n=1 Tax=Pararhizobium sp. IMCC21322 TaxID=3067903 RepID=UPI0027408A84|nr:adenosylcobinamide-GDP ribazoletransferase [Pararhizobium sp. IMCC21322]